MSYKKLLKFLKDNKWSYPETTRKGRGWVIKTLYKNNEMCVLQCKTLLNKITRVCHMFVYDKNEHMKNEFNFINNYYWCGSTSDEYFKKIIKED